MNEPYLIAHLVRKEIAFDVAICCFDMGTTSDPGPWWIIPTSGHRAYPYWWVSMFQLFKEHPAPNPPIGLKDFYLKR